jgi:hypothetical protein
MKILPSRLIGENRTTDHADFADKKRFTFIYPHPRLKLFWRA